MIKRETDDQQNTATGKLNYGVDAPKVIRNLLVIGVLLLLMAVFLPENAFPPVSTILKSSAFFPAICLIIAGVLMIAYGKIGKFRHRDRIIGLHRWKGDETVLDVGTGLGLLMIGVARKLTTGKAYGIDVFNSYDLSSNTLSGLQQNLRTANVTDRTAIAEESILETSFDAETFDVVVSNLCLHNIYEAGSRKKACREIYRIMKPGAEAIISDFTHIGEYKKNFEALGMTVRKVGTYPWDTFPPLGIIVARKND